MGMGKDEGVGTNKYRVARHRRDRGPSAGPDERGMNFLKRSF